MRLSNFRGELYEAAFYEQWAATIAEHANPRLTLVAKGIYTPKTNTFLQDGFFCDGKGRCIYNSHGFSIAEFDAMTLCDRSLQFFECTLTQRPENLRTLKTEALKKHALLRQLFPDHVITCTIVSDNPTTLAPFKDLAGFTTQWFDAPAVDPLQVAQNLTPQSLTPLHRMRSANSLNKRAQPYDCLTAFKALSQQLFQAPSLSVIKHQLVNPEQLFQRLCWGKVAAAPLEPRLGEVKAEFVYVLINFKNKNAPQLRYYFFDKHGRNVYEVGSPPKKLRHQKVSRIELASVREQAPLRDINDLLGLEEELLMWRSQPL